MKKIATILFLLMIRIVNGQGIIIDHTCTDISQIPESYIQSVKDNINFQWCGQSHAGQIPCGLEVLEGIYPQFESTTLDLVVPVTSGLDVYNGNRGYENPGCCTSITPEGYWNGTTGITWTFDTFTHWVTINVSAFMWCWQLEGNGTSYVNSYLAQMEAFELAKPNITFIYTTANAQAYGEAGLTRHNNNEIIRNYCIAHNKVLFDFGDIDCWYNGVQNTTTFNGVTYPVQNTAFDGQVCGHVNLLGAEYKARAIWWMMARIQGWDGNAGTQFNYELWSQQAGMSGIGLETDYNNDGQVNNKDKNDANEK